MADLNPTKSIIRLFKLWRGKSPNYDNVVGITFVLDSEEDADTLERALQTMLDHQMISLDWSGRPPQ